MCNFHPAVTNFLTWAHETFPNYAFDPDRLVFKFEEESKEFITDPSGSEAADVLMCLLLWTELKGIDLSAELHRKTERNKARTFAQNPNGTWSAVGEEAS